MIKSFISRARRAVDPADHGPKSSSVELATRVPNGAATSFCRDKKLRLWQLDANLMRQHSGHCITTPLPDMLPGDTMDRPGASMLRLFEDGVELGPGHSNHADIAQFGRGRFSHWSRQLYFSTSDGSRPLLNGCKYQVMWDDFRVSSDGFPVCSLPLGALLNLQRGIMSYRYKGIDCFKCPFDFALYQRLLWEARPQTIIEIGTWKGGSALWFADVLTAYGVDGRIHSFDIAAPPSWTDPRINFHRADAHAIASAAPADWVGSLPRPLLVIEDAGHMSSMTVAVLKHFAPLMESGEYIVVEDAIMHEMNLDEQYDGGPRRAIREFLEGNRDYVIDRDYCDYFGENVTWNVNGYLRRL